MRAAFHTFGCKLNQFETEALASAFRSRGFSLVAGSAAAEVYLVNTCTVTGRSEQKARAFIRRLARERPEALLIVTGCYAELASGALAELGKNVVVVSQADKSRLVDLPAGLLADGPEAVSALRRGTDRPDPFRFQVDRFSFHSRAFLKIQDGCDHRCAYCRVPLARGVSVSLASGTVLERARRLEAAGYRELVLTGVNISSYRSAGGVLSDLLAVLLAGTERARLRLSSLEPEAVEPGLAEVLSHPRICAHFHLPVQSGSDRVLQAMRRRYQADQVLRAAELLRGAQEAPFLAADLITGFPGESAEDFQATCELAERAGFAKLHVFPFSPRPGTAAAAMPGRVPERTRDERARALTALSEKLAERYRREWLGREVEAVLEKRGAGGAWLGLSGNYLRLAVQGVPPGGESPAAPGKLVRVRIEGCGNPCQAVFLTSL